MTIKLQEFQTLLNQAPCGVVVIDDQGKLQWINTIVEGFKNPLLKANEFMLASKEWPPFKALFQKGEPFYYLIHGQGFIFTPQSIQDTPNTTLLWIIPSDSPTVDFAAMQHDLFQLRKLANLGRMILEMLHELNNPLTGVSMGTQLIEMSLKKLKQYLPKETLEQEHITSLISRMEDELDKIGLSLNRASRLRQELLDYSKPHTIKLKPTTVSSVLDTILTTIEPHPIFKHLTLHKSFQDNSPTIMCDHMKLEQIIYNLLKNANEATQGKGNIYIREHSNAKWACIEFQDDGPGIPDELLDKLFSPFLTTKSRSGTGLGLSISKQIIEQHGGTFSVSNTPDSGACFQIKLPIVTDTINVASQTTM